MKACVRLELNPNLRALAWDSASVVAHQSCCAKIPKDQHFYRLLDVILCKTNSWRTFTTAVVPSAMPAFSKVNAAP